MLGAGCYVLSAGRRATFGVLRAGCYVLGAVQRARCAVRGATCAVLVLTSLSCVASAAPIIDRVMAVVSGTIITLSDVEAAIATGIIAPPKGPDPIGTALNELIDRTLMLIEVDRYAPPEPRPQRLDTRVSELRARLGGTDADRQLSKYGLSEQSLRSIARDDLRLQAYLNQRFTSVDPVTDEDVERYYREHQNEFTSGGVVQPLADVRQQVIDRVVMARRAQMIADWVKGLRSRTEVTILYLPGSAAL